jgi:hypothetical protein
VTPSYPKTKITIIGLGNLMEGIFEVVRRAVGRNLVPHRVNATTVDAADGLARQARLQAPVTVGDNLKALTDLDPDLIFFAPPPSAAPHVIQNDLRPYYQYLRDQNRPLPVIYAFPPTPHGRYYRDELGADVLVANLIPSALRTIGGKPVQIPTLVTLASPWPEDELERLKTLFGVLGEVTLLDPPDLLKVLGGGATNAALPEVVLDLGLILGRAGWTGNFHRAAEYMRVVLRQGEGPAAPEAPEPVTNTVAGPETELLDAFVRSWTRGVLAYMDEVGLPEDLAASSVRPAVDRMLWLAQEETEAAVHKHTTDSATKGGLLEMALHLYRTEIRPVIEQAAAALPEAPSDQWADELADLVRQTAHRVRAHGERLSESD